jgi:hypothetical protein
MDMASTQNDCTPVLAILPEQAHHQCFNVCGSSKAMIHPLLSHDDRETDSFNNHTTVPNLYTFDAATTSSISCNEENPILLSEVVGEVSNVCQGSTLSFKRFLR